MIPYGKHAIDSQDIESVIDVLRSEAITQGRQVPMFETAISHYCKVKYSVAVNSATSALHLACLSLDLAKGDWLWTTPISFVASANCARFCGANVDFVDIDPATYNICPQKLQAKLKQAQLSGRLPKVVIVVHMAGASCDMKAIWALSKQYRFKLVEDASHAIGATYEGGNVGNCRYSDITVFSFHPVKIITTAEGGVLTTNDDEIASRIGRLRCHGVTKDPSLLHCQTEGDWYYEQLELGMNYRMSDIHAALGLSQLTKLDAFIDRRIAIANEYREALSGLPLQLPQYSKESQSSWHLYIIRVKSKTVSRRALYEHLHSAGIGVQVHYIPIHLQPYYQKLGFRAGDCPEAEQYYQEALSLPLFPSMTQREIDDVVTALKTGLAC
ncbi:UDP-4-amino-4,6-dideoxy-N-acetyl-beta-L-altrosamine transaminase [Vibrio sp. DNB22_10_4]